MLLASSVGTSYGKNSTIEERTKQRAEHPSSPSDIQLAQRTDTIEIVDVQIVQLADGLGIVLETSAGELSRPFTSVNNRTFTAEIENAVLALPAGGNFRADSPIAGFDSVEVIQLDSQQVQVRVVSSEPVQSTNVDIAQQSLTFSIIASSEPAASDLDEEGADEESADSGDRLRLIVTAEKRPDEVQDVPISLTAFSTEEIEDADITSLEEIAGSTPNFSAYTPGRNFILYSIRGLSNFNFLS